MKIKELLPQLQPTNTMSDWERVSRNAFKHCYPRTKIFGCWFHYTQAIWRHIQKFGLALSYRNNPELAVFARQIMALPFLPCDLIHSTYSCLQLPELQQNEKRKLDGFLNGLIEDYDNEIARIQHGHEVTRSRKQHVRINIEYRRECKPKLVSGLLGNS